MNQLPALRADLQNTIKSAKGREHLELFMDSVRAALVREGKIKIHQDVMNRVVGAYRS
jgi:hypothetical protein